jgi:diadenylate cyclase
VFQNISNFIRSIHAYGWWRVGIELLIIGAVVFWVLRVLRGTGGVRLLKGVALMLVILSLIIRLVADSLGLRTLDLLYRQFLVFAGLAIVLVFQPELRRALMRLGETRLFRSFAAGLDQEIDELVEGIMFCAKRKIGALVAIEREVGLGAVAENGVRLNAELSATLLDTIFWPNSPLHDLGVIVSGGRIMYAGVQFPLAEPGDIERKLGSRHRAAVGMSQESDAVVLVVSEETGDVSVAESGKLIRKLTPDALRDLLLELLGGGNRAGATTVAATAVPAAPAPEAQSPQTTEPATPADTTADDLTQEPAHAHTPAHHAQPDASSEHQSAEHKTEHRTSHEGEAQQQQHAAAHG